MITIKTSAYSTLETKAIRDVFEEALGFLYKEYCTEKVICPSCPYKHICEDLHNAARYTRVLYDKAVDEK